MKKILKLIFIPVTLTCAAIAQSPYYGIKINTQADIAEGHISGKWQLADDPQTPTNYTIILDGTDGSITASGKVGIGTITPSEVLHTKDGNIKIEGTSGTHGLIFPDGTKQTTASTGGGSTQLPRNYIDGFVLENDAGDTACDIKINPGQAKDYADSFTIELSSALIKRLDANWSAGTGQGGFPSGLTLSANTWYHVFAIAKTDGTVDAGFDTSLIASNLLSDATDYVKYRRLGSVLTDSSSDIKQFKQVGDWFYWKDLVVDYNSGISTSGRNIITVSVPSGVNCIAKIFGKVYSSSGANVFLFTCPYQTDTAVSYVNGIMNLEHITGHNKAAENLEILTNTSSQIGARAEFSGAQATIGIFAYKDFRGKQL